MEVIETKYWTEVSDPVYPPDHPRSIISLVIANEKSTSRILAVSWFYGLDTFEKMDYSKATKEKYRKILLKYGIDLFSKPTEEMRKLFEESSPKNFSDFEFRSPPKLNVVKA